MKKILLTLLSLVALTVNAQKEVVFDFSSTESNPWGLPEGGTNKKTAEGSFTNNGLTIKVAGGEGYYLTTSTKDGVATLNGYMIFGKKDAYIELPAFDFKVASIEFVGNSAASASVQQNIYVGKTAVSTSTTGAQSTNVYQIASDKQAAGTIYRIVVESKHNSQVKKIIVHEVGTTTKQAAGMSFSASSVTVTADKLSEFVAPTLTKATNATLSWSSTNENVATVDQSGNVTLTGTVGQATIKVAAEENDTYFAGSSQYIVNVKEAETAPSSEVTLPYSESFSSSIGSFTADDKSLGEGLSYVWKFSSSYMKGSAYASKNIAAESWLVSPIIDLTSATDPILKFSECVNKYFGDAATEATVQISEASANSWTTLSITHPTVEDGKTYSSWADQEVSIKNMAGKKIKVAFVYKSTSNAAGTWEVKNFSVTENTVSSINAVEASEAVNSPAYNIAGQRVNADAKGIVIKGGKKYINK